MSDSTPSQRHPTLAAIGCGGFIGGIILALLLWSWIWLPIGLAIFIGTAEIAGTIDAVRKP